MEGAASLRIAFSVYSSRMRLISTCSRSCNSRLKALFRLSGSAQLKCQE